MLIGATHCDHVVGMSMFVQFKWNDVINVTEFYQNKLNEIPKILTGSHQISVRGSLRRCSTGEVGTSHLS